MNRAIAVGLLIITLAIFGCKKYEVAIDSIDFGGIESPFEIAIHGGVLSLYGKQYVRISKPATILCDSVMPINDAIVRLTDGVNVWGYELVSSNGEYETIDSIAGVVGNTYTLTVEYNGRVYTATDSMYDAHGTPDILPINALESHELSIYYSIGFNPINFGFSHPNIWVPVERRIVDSTLIRYVICDRIPVFTLKEAPPQGLFPSERVQVYWTMESEELFRIIKLSVSDNHYSYIISRLNETTWGSGIFSAVPGNTFTNVSKGGAGFFFASNAKLLKLRREDLKLMDE